jgi:arylsulfatase A-like enzyme
MRPPNLVLISLDSLRPEALGCYPRPFSRRQSFPWPVATPALDALAAEGVLFTNLIVQAPYTPASHASFFTGLNPPQHGIRAFFGQRLNERAQTLAQRLQRRGYCTAAFLGADALNRRYGLHRGFEVYDTDFGRKLGTWVEGHHRRVGEEATDRAIEWLEGASRPFFLFAHYFDAHLIAPHVLAQQDPVARHLAGLKRAPLARGPIYRGLRALDSLYGRYNRYGVPFHVRQARKLDAEVNRIVTQLRALGAYEDTSIVVMSDHGDAFGEHGEIGHRRYVYDTTLRVPLIVKGVPGPPGRLIADQVRSIDLAPTLLDLLGSSGPGNGDSLPMEGESLFDGQGAWRPGERVAYSETRSEKSIQNMADLQSHFVALRAPPWKLIVNLLDGTVELFDLRSDPAEMRDVSREHPGEAARLREAALNLYHSADAPAPAAGDFDEAERLLVEERLRDLGYL